VDAVRRSPWGWRVAVVGVVAATWAALWFTRPPELTPTRQPAEPSPSLGLAPIDAGDSTFCAGWTYSAFSSTRMFVPPNYPEPAPSAPPVRCFASSKEAISAGFRPAPTPAGDVVVNGICLVPTTPALWAACSRAALQLGYAVPCPSKLPTPIPGEPTPKCGVGGSFSFVASHSCVAKPDQVLFGAPPATAPPRVVFLFQQGPFAAPPTYGNVSGSGALQAGITIAADRVDRSRNFGLRLMICQDGQLLSRPRVLESRGTLRVCGNQFNGITEVVLSWARRGVIYEVAADGPPDENVGLVEAIVSSIDLVPPP
jgi:hypothetical protein